MTTSVAAAAQAASASFDAFSFDTSIAKAIEQVGYTVPTPIQAAAIPVVLTGCDMIGLAQTGTGKTAAFVLPMIQRLIGRRAKGVRALILAPTRELADQIHGVVVALSEGSNLRSAVVYGGVSHGRQRDQLQRKPEIVVACPGRLLDHLQEGNLSLGSIEMLVLDEADRMFDMGFLPVVRRIVKGIPKERQTMLFSATMPPEVQKLTNELLVDPQIIRVRAESPVATVTHSMVQLRDGQKGEAMKAWLAQNPEAVAVVFTKMKHTAKRVATKLSAAGHPATSLHGNLSQGQRQRALAGFKDGTFRVMVATDIAARGIDVDGVTHVVNYDMADTLESYIHRVGRAGRNSRSGSAVTFVTSEDAFLVRSIEKWLKGPISRLDLEIPEAPPQTEDDGESRSRQRRDQRFQRGPRSGGRQHSGERPRGEKVHGERTQRTNNNRRSQGDRQEPSNNRASAGSRNEKRGERREVNGNRAGANQSSFGDRNESRSRSFSGRSQRSWGQRSR